tara:strand:+ start:192 stop:923 length:732 start_codon:yes stop_codon:yes gene_type:complete
LRLIISVSFAFLCFSGCALFTETKSTLPQTSKLLLTDNFSGYYDVSGRIIFKHPEGKQNGEFLMQISSISEMKLRIFAPVVGSLIYELRVDPEKFLVLNYQGKNFVLKENSREVRQNLLGMDFSLDELRWLITGRLPKKSNSWKRKKHPTGELQLTQKTTEIRIRYNSFGHIESMKKFREEILEYKAKIFEYQNANENIFPKKIQIEDYTGSNLWMMYIIELNAVSGSMKKLEFNPPAGLDPL